MTVGWNDGKDSVNGQNYLANLLLLNLFTTKQNEFMNVKETHATYYTRMCDQYAEKKA